MEYIEEYANSLYNEQKSIETVTDKPMYLFTEINQQTGRKKEVTFLTQKMAVMSFLDYCDIFQMSYLENDGEYVAGESSDVYRITLTKISQ